MNTAPISASTVSINMFVVQRPRPLPILIKSLIINLSAIPNANTIYRVYDTINVKYFDNTQDLNVAKSDLQIAQNNFWEFYSLDSVKVLDSIPQLKVFKPKSNTITGTQTL